MNAITILNNNLPAELDLNQALDQFDQAASRFLATRKSKATQRTYAIALSAYREMAQSLGLDPLRADCIIAYNEELNQSGLANDTIRLKLKSVQSLFTWLYTFGLSNLKPEMVSELISLPEARKLSPRDLLSEDEAQRLLHAASYFPVDHCLITLMLNAGLRLSEVLDLKTEDIYQVGKKAFILVRNGKGGKSREVPITPAVYETVRRYTKDSTGDLFSNVYPRKVERMITRHCQRAGISRGITPHSLRHTYANMLAQLGTPLELIGELLGHSSFDVTKLYTRPGELLKRAELPQLPW